jgi:hypothetical protein
MAPPAKVRPLSVRILFGETAAAAKDDALKLEIHVEKDGSDTIKSVKEKIAQAAGGSITADDLLVSFGPNDRKMGKQYKGDPTVDETKLKLSQYSVLSWLERFPHWTLSVRLLPGAPPPPGVAIKQAAAIAEKKDPERAVQDGRAKGEIPKINDLPAPWGPKPFVPPPAEELVKAGYLPAKYPEGSSPLVNNGAAVAK